jgi:nicotinamidase/pyrazinamidase
VSVEERAALVIVDVQNGFCDDFDPSELPVGGGAAVASRIAATVRRDRAAYTAVVATKDHHVDPGRHFASEEHPADYVDIWPVHCVAGTPGSEFHPQIALLAADGLIDAVFYKGAHAPAYSGFEGTLDPGGGELLGDWLRAHGVTTTIVCGIATSHCVKDTALSALDQGFGVRVLSDLCTGVTDVAAAAALDEMAAAGAAIERTGGDEGAAV